jgi:hypothetical protein
MAMLECRHVNLNVSKPSARFYILSDLEQVYCQAPNMYFTFQKLFKLNTLGFESFHLPVGSKTAGGWNEIIFLPEILDRRASISGNFYAWSRQVLKASGVPSTHSYARSAKDKTF